MKTGTMSNYLIQAKQAEEQARKQWEWWKSQGFTENAAGDLVSPDGKSVIMR